MLEDDDFGPPPPLVVDDQGEGPEVAWNQPRQARGLYRAPAPVFENTGLFVNPTARQHSFATEASHHQVADSVCPLTDSLVCFVGGSRRGRLSLCVLQCDANKAVALTPLRGNANSLHCFGSRYGTLVAVGGNSYGDGLSVFCIGRKSGKVALLASAHAADDTVGHTNYVRFFQASDGAILVNQALNDRRGILQWLVKIKENAEDGAIAMELEVVGELHQRDYPNCVAVREVEDEEAGGETVCVGVAVNDGMMGSIFRVDRATGLIAVDSERPIDGWFAPRGADVDRNSRSANQPHYCAISSRGVFAVVFEQEERAVLIFPHVLKLTSLHTLPIALSFPESMVNAAFSHDGNMLACCSRRSVYVYATTPDALQRCIELHQPLPVQRLTRTFAHITGIAFSESKLFVSDNLGVYEYAVLGVASLKDLCVRRVVEMLKANPNCVDVATLPYDVANAIQPSAEVDVVFEGEELTKSGTRPAPAAAARPRVPANRFLDLLLRMANRGGEDREEGGDEGGDEFEAEVQLMMQGRHDEEDDNDPDWHD